MTSDTTEAGAAGAPETISRPRLAPAATFSGRMEQERRARERDDAHAAELNALGPWRITSSDGSTEIPGFESAVREVRILMSRGEASVTVERVSP